MTYGLGNVLQDFASDLLAIDVPKSLIAELNEKAAFNDQDQFEFNFPEVQGFLGEDEGQITWNQPFGGQNTFKYGLETEDDGLSGTFKSQYSGQVVPFFKELLGLDYWETVNEEYESYWEIDPVNFSATFGYKNKQVVGAYNPYSEIEGSNEFNYAGEVSINVDTNGNRFVIEIPVDSTVSGWDNNHELFGYYWYGNDFLGFGDHSYSSKNVITVPNVENCENYFGDFNENSLCVVHFECKKNLGDSILQLKLKHKFAFIKLNNYLAYVKSEDYNGDMVGFDEAPYLSFYFTDESDVNKPFKSIRRSYLKATNEDDLYLTIPFLAINDVFAAFGAFLDKFEGAFEYLFENPVKSAYWFDSFVDSVQPTTFDLSEVVEVSRFAIIDFSNAEFAAVTKVFSEEIYNFLDNVDFGWLEAFRAYVVEVQNAQAEVEANFVLPQ